MMSGGRPRRGPQRVHPELAELAEWFNNALKARSDRYPSILAFAKRHMLEKNQVYALFNGSRLFPLEATVGVATALVGREKAAEAEALWWRAKQASDQAVERARSSVSPPRSWDQIGWPELALQNILEAQALAADQLPYQQLGVEPPPLSTVYVRQRAKARVKPVPSPNPRSTPVDDHESDADTPSEQTVVITEILEKHANLLVVGEPGAGKSAFGQHLALRLSEIWLRQADGSDAPLSEPVLPLRVPAHAFVGATSWGAALVEATKQALGLLLAADPLPSMFEHRVQGARWLVIIDGLDEIVDRKARREVIQAIAAHCRPDGPYRIVVTTRQLPEPEMSPLRAQSFGWYDIEPFGEDEFRKFANRWFDAQAGTPADAAGRFVQCVRDGRLRELVRNPLLATLAAIAYTLDPGRPLPSNRLELYERFVSCLTDDDASQRATLPQLRRLESRSRERYQVANWTYERRMDLTGQLAISVLEGGQSLLAAATEWVDEHLPDEMSKPPGWKEDLRQLLIGTGLFVYDGSEVRFWHHSLAEFLAAPAYAAQIDSSFGDLETWITRGLKPAERDFVLFVFVLWARRTGNRIEIVMDRLLAGHPGRAVLAARLLVETGGDAALSAKVLGRLYDLAVGYAAVSQSGRRQDATGQSILHYMYIPESIEQLGAFVENPLVVAGLKGIASEERKPLALRILAANALGRVAGGEDALHYLEMLTTPATEDGFLSLVRTMLELDPDSSLARRLLRQRADDPTASPSDRCQAVSELVTLGTNYSGACQVVLDLLTTHQAMSRAGLRAALDVLLKSSESHRREAVDWIEQADDVPLHHLVEAVDAFTDAGMPDVACTLSKRLLGHPRCTWAAESAIKSYVGGGAEADLEWLLTTARSHGSPWYRVSVAEGLRDVGEGEAAAELAKTVAADALADSTELANAVDVWLSVEGSQGLAGVVDLLRELAESVPNKLTSAVLRIARAGFHEPAMSLAKDLLLAPRLSYPSSYGIGDLVSAWLLAGGPESVPELTTMLRQRPEADALFYSWVAEALAEEGSVYEAVEFAKLALLTVDDSSSILSSADAVKAWLLAAGPQAAETIMETLQPWRYSASDRLCLADHFASLGALSTAHTIWREVLASPALSLDMAIVATTRLVQTDGADRAIEHLHQKYSEADAEITKQRIQTLLGVLEAFG